MSFSPIIRVRKFLDKMKNDREGSPRLKRFLSRTTSEELGQKPVIDTSMDSYSIMEHINKAFPNIDKGLNTQSFSTYFAPNDTLENHFMYLPTEAILLVFSFLESDDLTKVRLVNKEWNRFADDNIIWKDLCINDWNVNVLLGANWKETYIRLHDLFSEGLWEGMSKWVEPAGFDNEQKTTAKLCFHKRRRVAIAAPSESKEEVQVAPTESQAEASNAQADTSSTVAPTTTSSDSPKIKDFEKSEFRIQGGGVTINCAAPSSFSINGERLTTIPDSSMTEFEWNKQFQNHTSVYSGKMDLLEGTVSGKITYHDGVTHWKGVFHYTKSSRSVKYQPNQVNA